MGPKISFGFKKQTTQANNEQIQQSGTTLSSGITSVFDQASGPIDETVTSRSIITSLGTSGFEGTLTQSAFNEIKPIPCPIRLPSPIRKQEHHITEIIPHKEKRKHDKESLEEKRKITDSSSQSVNGHPKNYGLIGGSCDDEEESLGPSSMIPAIKRDMQPVLEGHRGVLGTRGRPRAVKDSIINYDEVPVENFGLAMLMGMGYDPNISSRNVEPPEVKRRVYNKAGLGADRAFEEDRKNVLEKETAKSRKKTLLERDYRSGEKR